LALEHSNLSAERNDLPFQLGQASAIVRGASAGLTEGNELRSIQAQTSNVKGACERERLQMVVRREPYMLIEGIALWVQQSCFCVGEQPEIAFGFIAG